MKILIIDDHALFRDGLKYVLDTLDDHICTFEAYSSDSSIQVLKENPDMDLVLVDLNLPGETGFAVLENCRNIYPTIPFVVVSASGQQQDIQQAMDIGAMGYIQKKVTSKVMLNILQIILSGELYFPQLKSDDIKSQFTPRQLQVLEQMVKGHSNKVIAAIIDVAESTIKMHVTAILKKLVVTNRTQAVIVAKEKGMHFI
jgi:DNA-binding NarL/FixJ family response regulator